MWLEPFTALEMAASFSVSDFGWVGQTTNRSGYYIGVAVGVISVA